MASMISSLLASSALGGAPRRLLCVAAIRGLSCKTVPGVTWTIDPVSKPTSHRKPRRKKDKLALTSSEFLTVDEACELLRIGRNTLYEAIRDGSFPGVLRIGRLIRIRRSDLVPSDGENTTGIPRLSQSHKQ